MRSGFSLYLDVDRLTDYDPTMQKPLLSPDPAIGILPEPVAVPNPPEPVVLPSTIGENKHKHPKDVECGFCESRITTMRGEVIRMSERARLLEKAERDVEHWKAEVERLRTENAQLKESRTTPSAQSSGGWGS